MLEVEVLVTKVNGKLNAKYLPEYPLSGKPCKVSIVYSPKELGNDLEAQQFGEWSAGIIDYLGNKPCKRN